MSILYDFRNKGQSIWRYFLEEGYQRFVGRCVIRSQGGRYVALGRTVFLIDTGNGRQAEAVGGSV